VMLAPRRVQAGVPAVVAFLGGIPTANGHRLVSDIYTQLFEHGFVDKALNLARSELYKSEDPTWPNPVLFTRLQHGHLFGTHLVLDDTPDHEEYRDLLVHVRLEDEIREFYTVEATLDDGSIFSGGELLLNQTIPADKQLGLTEFGPDVFDILGYQGVDSGEFGLQLLDALFSGATRPAYDKAIDRAETQAEGRLRFRLWIDENAGKLHDTPWELLHRASGSQPVSLTASVKTPFSRYTALETPERQPIGKREYPLRLLIAISNPSDQPAMDIEPAVESFRQAMAEPIRRDLVRVTLMPGLSGLSPDVQRQLKAGGFRIKGGATGLVSILQLLPHVHMFHFIGRGYRDWHKDQVILFFENADGKAHLVFGRELVTKLADIKLPHLVFLSSADTVSLGSQISRLGIPAVVTMQGHVEEEHLLTRDFYHQLLTHGVVDRALNQARLTVFEPEQADWARPVLFMRLPQGQLFNPDPLKTK
jgi:hypothetical protein